MRPYKQFRQRWLFVMILAADYYSLSLSSENGDILKHNMFFVRIGCTSVTFNKKISLALSPSLRHPCSVYTQLLRSVKTTLRSVRTVRIVKAVFGALTVR